MIKYQKNGTLCLFDGSALPTSRINGRAIVYEHHLIFSMHHGYVPRRIGRIDGDIRNNRIENLYDMAFGRPLQRRMPGT